MKKALQGIQSFLDRHNLLPRFDEDTIFLMAASLVLLLVIDPSARDFALQVKANSSKVTLIILLGIGFAIYTAFFAYFKNEVQKFYMLWFAILTNFLAAIAVIQIYSASDLAIYYYFAPALNIAIAFVMGILWYADLLTTSALPHRSSSYSNILYGSILIAVFVFLADRVFSLQWPVTLSLSVTYATLFNQAISKYLPRIFPSRDKKIALMDGVLHKALDGVLKEYHRGNTDVVAIATETEVQITNQDEGGDPDEFIQERVKQIDRTNSVVATASAGAYTFKRFWFSPERIEPAVIIEVYPLGSAKGYQFCQVISWEEGVLTKVKDIIYLTKVSNIFI